MLRDKLCSVHGGQLLFTHINYTDHCHSVDVERVDVECVGVFTLVSNVCEKKPVILLQDKRYIALSVHSYCNTGCSSLQHPR